MSLDQQSSIQSDVLGENMACVTQEDGDAGAGLASGNASYQPRNRKASPTMRMTLIDEFPLRRESIVNLLRRHVSKGVMALGSIDELSAQWLSGADGPQCTIFSVGGQSVQQSPVAAALRRLAQLGEGAGRCGLIILSDRDDLEEVHAAFRAGAQGFIPTSLEPCLVIAAIRLVLAGGKFVPATMLLRSHCDMLLRSHCETKSLCGRVAGPAEPLEGEALHQWPARQLAVLRLLGEGKTNKHIAVALEMEETTVKVHVRHIMRKLGVKNRTQVALYVRRLGSGAEMAGEVPASAVADVSDTKDGIATARAF